jgi:hypothetical protein
VTITGGGGGGGTVTSGSFTEPVIGSSVTVAVTDPTVLAKFQNAKIATGPTTSLNYYVGNISGSNVTFQNLDPSNATGVFIASGATVSFGGATLGQAAIQLLPGQSQVSLNNLLTPAGVRNRENALTHGADPNSGVSGFNNGPAFAAMIAAAGFDQEAYIPAGFYYHFEPIVIDNGECISLRGESGHAITGPSFGGQTNRTTLFPYYVGDAVVITPVFTPLAYSHYTAGGADLWFMPMSGISNVPPAVGYPYISLSLTHCGDISGATAMCWEQFVDVPNGDGSFWALASSYGQRGNETGAQAFQFVLNPSSISGSPVNAKVTITTSVTGTVSVTGGSLSVGVHHIAGSYDGSFLRLYIDGVYIGRAAATGTIVQKAWETFIVGGQSFTWPGTSEGIAGGPIKAACPRLSTTKAGGGALAACARYTDQSTPYTIPLSELAADAYTQWVQPFTPANTTAWASGQFAVGQMGFSPAGIPSSLNVFSLLMGEANQASGVEVRDLAISSYAGGVFGYLSPSGLIENVTTNCRLRGITLYNNCYNTRVNNCRMNVSAQSAIGSAHCWAFGGVVACGNSSVENCISSGGTYGYVMNLSSSTLRNNYHGANGLGSAYCSNTGAGSASNYFIDGCDFSDEAGVVTEGAIYVSNTNDVQIVGGVVQNATTPGAYTALFDGVESLKWDTLTWTGTGSQTFKILSTSTAINIPFPYRIGNRGQQYESIQSQPWTDAACPVALHFDQTSEGINTVNFIADADLVFGASTVPGTGATFNDQFWGTIIVTDTHPWLSIGRNVILSMLWGKVHVWNQTAKTLTFKGPSGTGVALTTGQQCDIQGNGTNWVQVSAIF